MTERTTILIELDVEHTDGLTVDEVAAYAVEGARLAMADVGLPTPYTPAAPGEFYRPPDVTARTAEVRLAGTVTDVTRVDF